MDKKLLNKSWIIVFIGTASYKQNIDYSKVGYLLILLNFFRLGRKRGYY